MNMRGKNQSFGLTTLKSDHVAVEGSEVRFQFTGKSGKQWSLAMRDRRVARIIRACRSFLGRISYNISTTTRNCARSPRATSMLISGDHRKRHHRQGFPHLGGDHVMARHLSTSDPFTSPTQAKRVISAAVKKVAAALGNTRAVCRRSYIHPAISDAYLNGAFCAPGGRGEQLVAFHAGLFPRGGRRSRASYLRGLSPQGERRAAQPTQAEPDMIVIIVVFTSAHAE